MKEQEVTYVNKFSNSLLFWITGAIVALLIAVAAVAFWKKERTMHQVQPLLPSPSQARLGPTPRPAPTLTTKPSTDLTTNWKTYRNKKYGFELKYPRNWEIWADPVKGDPLFVRSSSADALGYKVGLSIEPLNPGRESVFDRGSKVKIINIIFAGKKAKLYTCPGENDCPVQLAYSKAIHFIDLPKNWTQSNEIFYALNKGEENSYEILEHILMTFRFLN